MKNKKYLLFTSIALFLISLFLIIYSLILIVGSNTRATERLGQWNTYVDQTISTNNESTDSSISDLSETNADGSNISSAITSSERSTVSSISSSNISSKNTYKPELFCLITFPSIENRKVVVVNGTTNKDLRGSAGHAKYSVNPGDIGNCLIFGHRDGVFRGFGKLKIGDKILIDTKSNKFEYTIIRMQVLTPRDKAITNKSDNQTLTLVTCYPFNYIGAAPLRYVVVAEIR